MADAKKYYWLKLKDTFFQDKEIKKLRKIAGGDTYTIIYLKMQLLSLKEDGKIIFDRLEDTFSDELALILDEEPENVKVTLLFLERCGLIEEVSDNEFILPQAIMSMGSETQGAARVRKHRENKTALQCNVKPLQCNSDVTNCNTEIREKRKEKRDKIKEIILIVEYLNNKAGTHYRTDNKKTISLLTALLKDYSVEEIKAVIDKKYLEWRGTEFEKFIRPETLFGSKFESYLNSKGGVVHESRIKASFDEYADL